MDKHLDRIFREMALELRRSEHDSRRTEPKEKQTPRSREKVVWIKGSIFEVITVEPGWGEREIEEARADARRRYEERERNRNNLGNTAMADDKE